MPSPKYAVKLTRANISPQACENALATSKGYDHDNVGDWNSKIIVSVTTNTHNQLITITRLRNAMPILTIPRTELHPQGPDHRYRTHRCLQAPFLSLHREQHNRAAGRD
jgi:hypothetical protein